MAEEAGNTLTQIKKDKEFWIGYPFKSLSRRSSKNWLQYSEGKHCMKAHKPELVDARRKSKKNVAKNKTFDDKLRGACDPAKS